MFTIPVFGRDSKERHFDALLQFYGNVLILYRLSTRAMDDFEKFIMDHMHSDVNALRLQYHGKPTSFSVDDACMQIEMRRKTVNKLPWFLHNPGFRFGTAQSAEQATNQNVALYHARLIGSNCRVLDMTAGLGIDAMTLALADNKVTAYELDSERVKALRHNAEILNIKNLIVTEGDSLKHLMECRQTYDWIFVDPARRDIGNNRCFLLQDSMPDVVKHQDLLMSHSCNVLIKASPLLDITQTIRDFHNVKSIFILSLKNEVKEVLIHLTSVAASNDVYGADDDGQYTPRIQAIDLTDSTDAFPDGSPAVRFLFNCADTSKTQINYAVAGQIVAGMYLYEAAAVMRKLNCAAQICARYPAISSLAKDSGLFVSETLYNDFPGRISTIKAILSSRDLKALKGSRSRVVSSCYPVNAADIRQKYKLKEGDDTTLYATTTHDGTRIMIVSQQQKIHFTAG